MSTETKELEENQIKVNSGTDVVAKYFFTAEGGGAEMKKSPEKKALKPGIRLHFFRYGVAYRDDDSEETVNAPEYKNEETKKDVIIVKEGESKKLLVDNKDGIKIEEVTVLSIKGVPTFKKFYHIETVLNEGFLYIINKKNPKHDFHEFKIDEFGRLQSVLWNKKNKKKIWINRQINGRYKDVREATGDKTDYVYGLKREEYWIGYSPIQWSYDYLKEVTSAVKDNKEEDLKKHMRLIDCVGIKKEEKKKHVCPFTDVSTIFPENHPGANILQNTLQNILVDEKNQDEKGDNDLFEDMFITLHDGVSIADDIIEHLDLEIANHRANIDAMRFGINPAIPKQHLLNNTNFKNISHQQEQQAAMFTLAQTSYHLVYNDPDTKYDGGEMKSGMKYDGLKPNLKYSPTLLGPVLPSFHYDGNGLYKEKLLNILGVKERKKQRALIRSIQADLASYMKCDYYHDTLVHFSDGNEIAIISGKLHLYNQLSLLAINPHDFDRGIDLKIDQEKINEHEAFLIEKLKTNDGNNNFDKILTREVNIDDTVIALSIEQDIDLANKVAAVADKIIESASKITTKKILTTTIRESMDITVTNLNRVGFYDVKAYQVENAQFYGKIPKDSKLVSNADDFAPYRGGKDISRIKVNSPHIVLKESVRGKHTFGAEIETTKYNTIKKPTKAAAKAEAFLNNKAFRRSVAILQVFNLGAAMVSYSSDRMLHDRVKLVGISAELSEAVLRLGEAKLIRRTGKGFLEGSGAFKALKGASIAGAAITVVMCAWDAYDSFDARDGDAAWAYIGAGIAYTGSTVAVIFASASWAGPLGWLCAGIGLGFMYLAYKFTDTPLEKFFKHIPFSDAVPFARRSDEPVWKYNQRFYAKKDTLMGEGNNMLYLADFVRASAELYDLLVCSKIQFKATKFSRASQNTIIIPSGFGRNMRQTISDGYASSFEVTINFNQFLVNKEQLYFEVYYYPLGTTGSYQSLSQKDLQSNVRVVKGTEQQAPQAIVNFSLPKTLAKQATSASSILFLCRLQLEDKHYYPVDYKHNERMLGAVIGVRQLKATSTITLDATFSKHTQIAAKNELLNQLAWKNKK